MSKRKHSRRRDQRPVADGVEPVVIVARHWPKADRSDLDLANPVEQDTRHYCRECKRKREERFMVAVGRAAFGKKSWVCNDNRKLCAAVRAAKQKEAVRHVNP